MLLNRIPLRVAMAAGAATVVSGAAFGVSAFADSGSDAPVNNASSQVEGSEAFFPAEGEASAAPQEVIEQAESNRQEALEQAGNQSSAELQEEEEEEEEEQMPEVSPGSAREIAQQMLSDYGWGGDQFSCLDSLWERESGWNHTAQNPSSGAYGIPQALPGSKMATAGDDWQTNPATQIEWGLGYIEGRYGSPCEAWAHSEANGWY